MLDSYTDENAPDFNQRYVGTYGWMVRDGKKQFVYLTDTDEDHLYFNKGRGTTFNVKINSGIMFEFIPVDRGWYTSTDGTNYFLERRPQRQWKRGISNGNTRIFQMLYGGLDAVEPTYPLLNSIFSTPQTHAEFVTNKRGVLSKHFAVDHSGNVYFYNEKIGTFDGSVFKLFNDLVKQELQDTIKRKNYPFGVVVNV